MKLEIERKFLVNKDGWRPKDSGEMIAQGYLCRDKERTVRVRLKGDKGYLTVKGETQGCSRAEYEYPIPASEALELLQLCEGAPIKKTRYLEDWGGNIWEIDVFAGENTGLVLAEIELDREDAPFVRPPWLGAEVTADGRYCNSCLAARPYKTWDKTGDK